MCFVIKIYLKKYTFLAYSYCCRSIEVLNQMANIKKITFTLKQMKLFNHKIATIPYRCIGT